MITSRANTQYKRIRKLLSSPRARNQEGLFVVEGERLVREAPAELVETVCVSESYAADTELPAGTVLFSDEVFRSLSDTVSPQGIMALIKQPSHSLDDIIQKKGEAALFLLLDDIRDPGNLGTIVRTAEAAGSAGIIMSPGCVDIFNPKVIRSTMGSIYRVKFAQSSLCGAISILKKAGVNVYAASLDADINYNEEKYGKKNAFVIGNEAAGVSREVMERVDKKIKIPMEGSVESLNAAVSAAIIMYGIKKWT